MAIFEANVGSFEKIFLEALWLVFLPAMIVIGRYFLTNLDKSSILVGIRWPVLINKECITSNCADIETRMVIFRVFGMSEIMSF